MCTLLRPLTCKLIGTMSGTAYPLKYSFPFFSAGALGFGRKGIQNSFSFFIHSANFFFFFLLLTTSRSYGSAATTYFVQRSHLLRSREAMEKQGSFPDSPPLLTFAVKRVSETSFYSKPQSWGDLEGEISAPSAITPAPHPQPWLFSLNRGFHYLSGHSTCAKAERSETIGGAEPWV